MCATKDKFDGRKDWTKKTGQKMAEKKRKVLADKHRERDTRTEGCSGG